MPHSPFYPQTTPRRSAIPRVVGILAIIFACVGAGFSVIFTLGPLSDIRRWSDAESLGFVVTWLYLWAAISFALFALHLVGGVMACSYRAIGLRLLTAYAVAAIALVIIDVILMNGYVSNGRLYDSLTMPRTVFALFALPWPVVVLALVNNGRAKRACAVQGP